MSTMSCIAHRKKNNIRFGLVSDKVSAFEQQRRRQQQLAVATTTNAAATGLHYQNASHSTRQPEKRVFMKFFWECLQLAADVSTFAPSSKCWNSQERFRLLEDKRKHYQQRKQQQQEEEINLKDTKKKHIRRTNEEAEEWKGAANELFTAVKKENQDEFAQKEIVTRIHQLIKQRRHREALLLFDNTQTANDGFVFSSKITSDLFFLLSRSHPVKAYNILQYYNTHHVDVHDGKCITMYQRICTAIRELDFDYYYATENEMNKMVSSLIGEIEGMNLEKQQILYPALIVSLVTQRRVSVGRFAHRAFDNMVDLGLTMEMGWLTYLLSLSRYNRQDDLPYHEILSRLVCMGGIPHATVVMPVIYNMFPYTETEKVHVAMQALIDLEKNKNNRKSRQYITQTNMIDMSTLEMISTGAAKVGDYTLILLVWELLEVYGRIPTETIFENTVLAFVRQPDGLERAFLTMKSMKEYGYVPSRALIRSVSYLIRHDSTILDGAMDVLMQSQEQGDGVGNLLSLESLNVVMSGYSERGDTGQAIEILKLMKQFDIQPNQDSYSFALEVLGKEIHRKVLHDDHSHVHRSHAIADFLLASMEKDGVNPSSFVVRQYVELLCQTGEVGTATSVVDGCLSQDKNQDRLACNKSLYRVALANAETGNHEKAKELARRMSEQIPLLHRKIRSKEQRHNHQKGVKWRQSNKKVEHDVEEN
jgi:pentatricopeptide repeat protein